MDPASTISIQISLKKLIDISKIPNGTISPLLSTRDFFPARNRPPSKGLSKFYLPRCIHSKVSQQSWNFWPTLYKREKYAYVHLSINICICRSRKFNLQKLNYLNLSFQIFRGTLPSVITPFMVSSKFSQISWKLTRFGFRDIVLIR